jgi:hypothetical protein
VIRASPQQAQTASGATWTARRNGPMIVVIDSAPSWRATRLVATTIINAGRTGSRKL